MSLIQDGLKRKLSEQKVQLASRSPEPRSPVTLPAGIPPPGEQPPASTPPAAPPPAPPVRLADTPSGEGRSRKGILLAVLLIAVAGVVIYRFVWPTLQSSPTAPKPGPSSAPAGKGAPVSAVVTSKPATIRERVLQMESNVHQRVETTRQAIEATTGSTNLLSTNGVPTPAVEVKAVPAAVVEPTPPTPAVPVAVQWPRVTVSGIISRDPARGAALINGRMVLLHETVEGARLVEVQAKGVVLEFEGERRVFGMGSGSK